VSRGGVARPFENLGVRNIKKAAEVVGPIFLIGAHYRDV